MSDTIQNRYDFVFLFDVKDGNPNGDPDAGNLPRVDPETGQGLVTDVCLKRKIRNYVQIVKQKVDGYDIFVKEKAILNELIGEALKQVDIKAKNRGEKTDAARSFMCKKYYDIRTFGAVMSTGENAGQVRGPVQLTFARSINQIIPLEHTITRIAVTTQAEANKQQGDNRTMGRKFTVPYGLYRCHGFISASFAEQTKFNNDDLSLFWQALKNMFDHDRSAARGEMTSRKLVVFQHESRLGNYPAHKLLEMVIIPSVNSLPKDFSEYKIAIPEQKDIPAGVKLIEMF